MRNLYFILLLAIFLVILTTNYYYYCVYLLLGISIIKLLDNFGKGITLRELIAVYTIIIYLVTPILGYEVYSSQNFMARLWKRFMPVNRERYFEFVLPAVNLFLIGLFWPVFRKAIDPDNLIVIKSIIDRIKIELTGNSRICLIILLFGLFGFFGKRFINFSPVMVYLFSFYLLLFTAFLYLYISPNFKFRKLSLLLIIGLVLWEAVQSGMFTVVVYMGITIASMMFIGREMSLFKKLVFFVVGIIFVFALQLSKDTYRKKTWKQGYTGSKSELLIDLMTVNLQNTSNVFDVNTFFPIYTRMNQGFNVGLVMRRIPSVQPFDNGESIMLTVASAIVPRFLWQDKLQSGGVYNMGHFAGFKLRGWSTNIGPVGEAYGNFGIWGGVFYMFVFGLFVRFVYLKVLSIAIGKPLVLLWMPVLFFELSYSMENDTLQALNSIVKISIFVYVLYLIFPYLFGSRHRQ